LAEELERAPLLVELHLLPGLLRGRVDDRVDERARLLAPVEWDPDDGELALVGLVDKV
jgi:hypothetical protein